LVSVKIRELYLTPTRTNAGSYNPLRLPAYFSSIRAIIWAAEVEPSIH